MSLDCSSLPDDLPVPQDDDAASHLAGMRLPAIFLRATNGSWVDLSELTGRIILYAYPRTGVPGEPLPNGWDGIPGARGCTPQACAWRDHRAEVAALGARVYGLSTQPTSYQREVVDRLHLPFPLLSDDAFCLTDALRMPTFEASGMRLLKRLTMVLRDGLIEQVFYPVFPSDSDASTVISWLQGHPGYEG